MLKKLYIKNYALIEELDVHFEKGFNVITGETGAGKSIIMDALSLILGARAESDALQDKNQKCIVEAEFEIKSKELDKFLEEKGFDTDASCFIRREIAPNGKSRSFINDTPATVQLIKEITQHLVDVHSQHQTLEIANSLNQFEVLDSFAGTIEHAATFTSSFDSYKAKKNALALLEEQQANEQKEKDYNTYLFEELSKAELKEGEEDGLESEIEKLANADAIKLQLSHAFEILDNPQGTNALVKELSAVLSKIKLPDENFASLRTRVESSLIELKDITAELEDLSAGISNNPAKLEELESRSDLLNNLMVKHRVKTVTELIVIREQLSGKLIYADGLSDKIEQLNKEIEKAEKDLRTKGKELFESRQKQVAPIEKKIAAILADLNMPHAKFVVKLEETKDLNAFGNCSIDFLFTANKGSDPKPVQKVASGGEFARLMLAIKSIIAGKKNLQTMIFDEIDSGVSGEVAGKMGEIMKKISAHIQVFSITHLPQVAVKGNYHYKVMKSTKGNKTVSRLIKLDENNRIEEIAKMLSGEKLTPEALANAKVLLQ
ncbi:MAG TPA: DNA repair protein RecN [Flavobacteriales bacterium]|nr:DNA repair protein RecN [Flavobacteriales bacterium]